MKIKNTLKQGATHQNFQDFKLSPENILLYKRIIYVPDVPAVKEIILHEMHKVPYVGHPEYQKTLTTIKKQFYYPCLKREVANYIAKCMEFQR